MISEEKILVLYYFITYLHYKIEMKPFNFDMEEKKQFKCDIYQVEGLLNRLHIVFLFILALEKIA